MICTSSQDNLFRNNSNHNPQTLLTINMLDHGLDVTSGHCQVNQAFKLRERTKDLVEQSGELTQS